MGHPLVIGAAIFMYAVEFFADKIPFVDSAWGSVHTFIRPAGAGLVGFMAGTEYGPLAQVVFSVLTGAIALDMYAVKASSRVAINASPEPVTNIAASIVEDSVVVWLFWLFIKNPFLAVIFMIAALVVSFFVLRFMWCFVLRIFKPGRSDESSVEPANHRIACV